MGRDDEELSVVVREENRIEDEQGWGWQSNHVSSRV
jgi:hypothetical protein